MKTKSENTPFCILLLQHAGLDQRTQHMNQVYSTYTPSTSYSTSTHRPSSDNPVSTLMMCTQWYAGACSSWLVRALSTFIRNQVFLKLVFKHSHYLKINICKFMIKQMILKTKMASTQNITFSLLYFTIIYAFSVINVCYICMVIQHGHPALWLFFKLVFIFFTFLIMFS